MNKSMNKCKKMLKMMKNKKKAIKLIRPPSKWAQIISKLVTMNK